MPTRVLLLASTLPGDAMPGAVRVQWLLDGLPSEGFEVHLLSLRNPHVKRADGARPVPEDSVTVIRNTCKERAGHLAAMFGRDGGLERGMVSHPSQVASVEGGLKLVGRFRPDLILSTSPPARISEVAYRISLESGVPWVADWRDPVSLDPLGVWISRNYYEAVMERERLWLEHARVNVVTAPSYARMLASHHAGVKVEVVTNGWAPGDASPTTPVSPGTLLYSGSAGGGGYGFVDKFPSKLSRRIRNRLSFGRLCHVPFAGEVRYHAWGKHALRAISRVKDRVSALLFRGLRGGEAVMRVVRQSSLSERTRVLPWSLPGQARSDMSGAHVLWLCLSGTSRTGGEPVIASKVFTYLASGRPIFAALPPECDTAGILRGQPGVFMPDPHDEDALVDALKEALSLPPEKCFERDIGEYRRDRLAEKMVKVLCVTAEQ